VLTILSHAESVCPAAHLPVPGEQSYQQLHGRALPRGLVTRRVPITLVHACLHYSIPSLAIGLHKPSSLPSTKALPLATRGLLTTPPRARSPIWGGSVFVTGSSLTPIHGTVYAVPTHRICVGCRTVIRVVPAPRGNVTAEHAGVALYV